MPKPERSSDETLALSPYVFSMMVGMARCAVPARVVAGGPNKRATLAFAGVAPLHAARTSQRDVPNHAKQMLEFREKTLLQNLICALSFFRFEFFLYNPRSLI